MKAKACRNKQLCMFGISFLILTLITAVILGLIAAPGNPITWLLIVSLLIIPYLIKKISAKQFVEWKDEYSVGLESIDNQHKKLLNLINQLQTAVDFSTGEEFEREALDALVDYTKTHFSYEEGLMKDNGYPDYEPHKAQHEKMIKHVEDVLSEYEKDQDTAMSNATAFLKDWLITHINGTDKQYSEFLIGKGVK
ncbi:MAG: bacteriohemerythrin [Gammaproteobacteria bacterium]|nr:bacteriohemerythrin [Gammaproteobacteria bacterium]